MKLILLALLLGVSQTTIAAEQCRVIGITDGDTLRVLCAGRTQVKVRLTDIDAPESRQPFGNASKQSLSDLCFGKSAELSGQKTDRYGRLLARVHCEGVDANATQVSRGMAWGYDKYVTDQSLYALQDQAIAKRRGLWRGDNPIAPWEWRRKKR